MIFEHDKKSGKITAILNAGESTQAYECLPTVCMNPVCDCNDVFLKLERTDETHNVGINIEERTLIERENVSTIDEFANRLFEQLDESDFKILKNVYAWHKQSGSEKADYSQLYVEFPKDEVEREGTMILYNYALPHANRFDVTLEGILYAVEDSYCVKNKCHCTEAVLCFYPVSNEDTNGYTEDEIDNLAFSMWVDYQSKTWTLDDKSQVKHLGASQARSALENRYNNFYALVRQRHQRLKLLYGNYLKTLHPEKNQKVGRNEPCPCGSGKKYKKCCGSEGTFAA